MEQEEIIHRLNTLLANESVLYAKVRNYHWNVEGINFEELHKFFEEIYNELVVVTDDVAEKVRIHKGRPLSTLKEFLEYTNLKEEPGVYPDAKQMLANLEADFNFIVAELKNDIDAIKDDDPSTVDFMTQLLEKHEKTVWMINSMQK